MVASLCDLACAFLSAAVLGMTFEQREYAEEVLVVRVHVAEKRGREGGRGRVHILCLAPSRYVLCCTYRASSHVAPFFPNDAVATQGVPEP